MANFRLLGNALIDFSRVRAVVPETTQITRGFWINYIPEQGDDVFVADLTPVETLKQFYADALKQDERLPLTEPLSEHCH